MEASKIVKQGDSSRAPAVRPARKRRTALQSVGSLQPAPSKAGGVTAIDEMESPAANIRREREPIARTPTRDGVGASVAVGAGAEVSRSGTAAQWNVALIIEPSEHVGLEVGYAGTKGARVTTSSVDVIGRWYLSPGRATRSYVFGGVGWRHVHGPHAFDVATVPTGIGVTYGIGRWRADVRATLRLATGGQLHTLGVGTYVGAAF
jgi:hypothetical protein